MLKLREGQPRAAALLIESELAKDRTSARLWFLLGACRQMENDLTAAADAFSRSLVIAPANPEVHLAYISVLRAIGNAFAALAAGKQALARIPGDARLFYATALCLEDAGQNEAALAHYDAAIELAPGTEDAHFNKAVLLSRIGRFAEAAALLASQREAHPDSARILSAYVDSLIALGRYAEALEVLKNQSSDDVVTRVQRGVALASLRRFDEAQIAFAEARARDALAVHRHLQRVAPGSDPDLMLSPENIYFGRGWTALGQCDWSEWDHFVTEMRRAVAQPEVAIEPAVCFMSRLLPLSGTERHAIAHRVASAIELKTPALPPAPPRGRERVRIGVLSPDFREHLNAYLLLPLLELLDRTRFELHAYSLTPDDGSGIRTRVRSTADGFRDLHDLPDRGAALAIRNDDVDILIDAGGYTTGARFAITAQRPARLQVNYLGFSCTLGSPRVDYAIVDQFAGNDDKEWTEARIFLPHTHFLYDFRVQPGPATVMRRDYGLPDDAFVYCAFHRAEKISPDVFDLWMRILAQVPRSVLWFRALSEQIARNLRTEAAERGVDPARLAFAPFEPSHDPRYLARHALGDLMLDSLHHNAMTSACDALGAGLPLLTLPGNAMAARAGESLVRAAGLPELVARDKDDYVNKAIRLATEPALLRELKNRLRANRHTAPLFDTAGRVRALERAFQGMYDRMVRGEPPASFDVRA